MTKVLVTGASGFIGSHLVDSLLSSRVHVVAVDLWISEDLSKQLGNRYFTFIEGDIRNAASVESWCREADIVVHLASILGTSETISMIDPMEVAHTNVLGTLSVLNAVRKKKGCRVIYPSTPDVPWVNPYKITKQACERFCQMYAHEYEVDVVVLKLTNVYGPRERWLEADMGAVYNYQKVVPTFIMRCLAGQPLPIFGDGDQSASYAYVADVVRAFRVASEGSGTLSGEIIPIGRPESISVNQLAELVAEATGREVGLERLPMRPGEVKVQIAPDVTIAERLLGFRAEIDLAAGLQLTVPYYRQVIEDGRRRGKTRPPRR